MKGVQLVGVFFAGVSASCPAGFAESTTLARKRVGVVKVADVTACATLFHNTFSFQKLSYADAEAGKVGFSFKQGKKPGKRGRCKLYGIGKVTKGKMRSCKGGRTCCSVVALSPSPPPPAAPAKWYLPRDGVGSCSDSGMAGRGATGGEAGGLMPYTNHCHGPAYGHECTSGPYGNADALGKEGWRITCGDNSCQDKSRWYFACGDVSNMPTCTGSAYAKDVLPCVPPKWP